MWLSLHVYLGEDPYGRDVDRLLLRVVSPLTEELAADGTIGRFFFVRYADPRCHLRLRLDLTSGAATDEGAAGDPAAAIRARLEAAVAELDATAEVRQVDYEPEWQRYGGPHGVPVAEEHFHLSSRTALALLTASGEELSRRLGRTLFTSVVLVHGLDADREATAKFLAAYAEELAGDPAPIDGGLDEAAIRQALDTLLTAVDAGEGLGVPFLDPWLQGTAETLRQLQRLQARRELETPPGIPEHLALHPILGSYLHMHHNRLGLHIPAEKYLARLAAKALRPEEGGHE